MAEITHGNFYKTMNIYHVIIHQQLFVNLFTSYKSFVAISCVKHWRLKFMTLHHNTRNDELFFNDCHVLEDVSYNVTSIMNSEMGSVIYYTCNFTFGVS